MDNDDDVKIPFVAFGRVRDVSVLCVYCEIPTQQANMEHAFVRVLQASREKLSPGQRERLRWGDGAVYCQMNQHGDILYYMITSSMAYPERMSFGMLEELEEYVERAHGANLLHCAPYSLVGACGKRIGQFVQKYENPESFDRVSRLLKKTSAVRSIVDDTIQRVIENGECMEQLEKKSQRMSQASAHFTSATKEVRRHFWWKAMKITIALACLVVIIFSTIVGMFCDNLSLCSGSSETVVVDATGG